MDAHTVAGSQVPGIFHPLRRKVKYKVGSVRSLLGYRKERIKGVGEAVGLPMVPEMHSTLKSALVTTGTSFRGEDMTPESLDPSVVKDFKRIGCLVVKGKAI